MNFTIIAICGYIIWTMLLLLALAAYRTSYNKTKKRTSLKFDASGQDLDGFGERLTRAHANCYESYVFVIGPMILALATGSAIITNSLALVVLVARIVQSSIHIVSVANAAIMFRFIFFLIQFVISAYWIFMLLQKFL